MQTVTIPAELRQGKGKSVTRKLRAEGTIPANLYGVGAEPVTMQIKTADIDNVVRSHGSNVLVELQFEGQDAILTLIREHQVHPVSGSHVHLDFQRVHLGKPLHVDVPIKVVGEAPGVKNFSGILEQVVRDLSVSCLPREIPDFIEVDISKLGINDAVHVRDLKIDNVELLADGSQTIVMVVPPRLSTAIGAGEGGAGDEAGAEGVVAGGVGDAKEKDS